jgi:hypothetical protein
MNTYAHSSLLTGIVWMLMLGSSCGKKTSDSTPDPNCDLTSNFCVCDKTQESTKTCIDSEGSKRSSAKSNCTTGIFKTDASCPSTSRAGTCKLNLFNDKTYYRYYSTESGITGAAACATLWLSTGGTGTYEWSDN